MKQILIEAAFVLTIITASVYFEKHAEAQDAAYTKYEECVQREYGTTPSAYYQEHGVSPVCGE